LGGLAKRVMKRISVYKRKELNRKKDNYTFAFFTINLYGKNVYQVAGHIEHIGG
jgi:hypothetical protein